MLRRQLLRGAAAAGLLRIAPATMLAGFGRAVNAADRGVPFDYAWLKGRARYLAQQPYRAPADALPKALADLNWDQFQAIRDRPDRALWADLPLNFRVAFFHLGWHYGLPVQIHEVRDGKQYPIDYDPALFDFGKSGVKGRRLPKALGFAGLRLRFHTDWRSDVLSFLGASYFRAVGASKQFGLSARGLAIDTGGDHAEEFPRFTEFWLERPAPLADRLTIHALLDSPSVAGAYRFDVLPGEVLLMDVEAALYPRKPIERLGIAPLTSMFYYGENDRRKADDWRPEIHDSDGLALWTGGGEWIWRPLTNSPVPRLNSFFDQNPRGFGLVQRDRDFDHYQDDAVFYERRPSVWVEFKPATAAAWSEGAVQLLELPGRDETEDNIVAFWNPAAPVKPGEERLFSYRLFWGSRMPYAPSLARALATRDGIGGVVGQQRKYFSWRFVVDFAGGPLETLGEFTTVEPIIRASRGRIELASARPIGKSRQYRAMFDLRPDDGVEPIDLRLFLSLDGEPLSETWVYQWLPPPPGERKF